MSMFMGIVPCFKPCRRIRVLACISTHSGKVFEPESFCTLTGQQQSTSELHNTSWDCYAEYTHTLLLLL